MTIFFHDGSSLTVFSSIPPSRICTQRLAASPAREMLDGELSCQPTDLPAASACSKLPSGNSTWLCAKTLVVSAVRQAAASNIDATGKCFSFIKTFGYESEYVWIRMDTYGK